MVIRVPDYYDDFRCLAGACPHSCCTQWEVVIDEAHAARYAAESGPLGDKLRRVLRQDDDGDLCFALSGGRCPFLDGENLCEIHRQLGPEATSVTCQEHPRFTEDYGSFREITLSASCPAANALLLGSEAPLTFTETEDGTPCEAGDPWLEFLLPLRRRMMALLTRRSLPLNRRLQQLLLLASEAQTCLDEDRPEDIAALPLPPLPQAEAAPLFPAALSVLEELETLEPDWPALLRQAAAAPHVPVCEAHLERIAAYFLFRYLLKTVNDGDLLGRVQLLALAVLTIRQLAGVCGLPEALRRFSCEIEHSDDNIDALSEAFRLRREVSAGALLLALEE